MLKPNIASTDGVVRIAAGLGLLTWAMGTLLVRMPWNQYKDESCSA